MKPPFLIQHLCAVAQDYQDGIFAGTDDIIGRLTGKPRTPNPAKVEAAALVTCMYCPF